MAGEDLLDAAELAKRRSELLARHQRLYDSLSLVTTERLQRLNEVVADPTADLVELDRDNLQLVLPGDSAPSLAMLISSTHLALLRPGAEEADLVPLQINKRMSPRSITPYLADAKLHWLVLSALYDDETYSVARMELTMLDQDSRLEWTYVMKSLEGDAFLNAHVVVADVLADERPEILLLDLFSQRTRRTQSEYRVTNKE